MDETLPTPRRVTTGHRAMAGEGPRRTEGHTRPCEECGSIEWTTDLVRGEVTCGACGLVAEEAMIDPGAEWTNHSGGDDRSRAGAPTTLSLADKGLNTTINPADLRGAGRGSAWVAGSEPTRLGPTPCHRRPFQVPVPPSSEPRQGDAVHPPTLRAQPPARGGGGAMLPHPLRTRLRDRPKHRWRDGGLHLPRRPRGGHPEADRRPRRSVRGRAQGTGRERFARRPASSVCTPSTPPTSTSCAS